MNRSPVAWFCFAVSIAAPASADWRQSRADERCSGAAPSLHAPESGEPRTWSFDGSGRVWGYRPGMTVWSSPAIAEVKGRAVLAAGSYDSKLYCLDAANGEPLWSFTAGAPISSTPAFWNDGRKVWLFVAAEDRLVYALHADTGRKLWVHEVQKYRPTLGGARLGAPAVGRAGGRDAVFVSYWVWDSSLEHSLQRAGVTALDAREGRRIWSAQLGDNQMTDPLYVERGPQDKGALYLGSHNGVLYALDADNGRVLWQHRELDAIRAPPAFAAGEASTAASPALVIVASKYGMVRGLRAVDGKERWKYKTGDRITGSPAVYRRDGAAYAVVGSYDRHLYVLHARDGRLKWRHRARAGIYSSAALALDHRQPLILFSAWDHALHAVSPKDGSLLFSRFTGRPLWEVAGLDESNWSSPSVASVGGTWMAFAGSYDGRLRGFRLEQRDDTPPPRRSNLAFWLSFPVVLGLVGLLSLALTGRYRRRRRNLDHNQ